MTDATLIHGDAREVLASLPAQSVHCVITSPPYHGLRKYQGPQGLDWADGWHGAYGLESTPQMWCEHTLEWLREVKRVLRDDASVWLNLGDSYSGSGPPRGDAARDGGVVMWLLRRYVGAYAA